ncbi:MAG: PAS domain S-box protein [Cyclobacteriaceae bacterium]|nr:PAS domain S-box protein [Cyclobacteriaceae bacterium]
MKTNKGEFNITYTGVIIGIIFPVIAIICDLLYSQLPLSVDSIASLYLRGPLHWIILLAPIILGGVFKYFQKMLMKREEALLEDQKRSETELNQVELFISDIEKADFAEKHYAFQNVRIIELLTSLKNKLKHQREEDEKAKWVAEGHARFGEIFRTTSDLVQLSDIVIMNLVKYLGLVQGFVFTHQPKRDGGILQLVASYAYDRKKYLTKQIGEDEGLVGQCYLENDKIVILKVPQGYLTITSGLGDANPDFLLLIPIKNNETKVGVIELAGFTPLPDYKIKFVEKVCEGFAMVIRSIQVNDETKALLHATQTQTEQLKSQEEEMRQNLEELHATQEAMERKSLEAEEQNNKLNAILDSAVDGIVTINEQGVIETVNESCLKMFGYSAYEMIGKNISMIMPDPHRSQHAGYLQRYLATGQAKIIGQTRAMQACRKDGRLFPVELAVNEATVGASRIFTGIVRDVSDRVQLEAERMEQMEELRTQEEELRQNMEELHAIQEQLESQLKDNQTMRVLAETREHVLGLTTILSETDLHGTITFVNEKFCQVAKYERSELIGKPHNVVRHPDMPKDLFRLFWQSIQAGKVFKGIVKNRAKDGSSYWVDATIVPIKDENGEIVKYIGARYHITNEAMAIQLYNQQADQLGWPRL